MKETQEYLDTARVFSYILTSKILIYNYYIYQELLCPNLLTYLHTYSCIEFVI